MDRSLQKYPPGLGDHARDLIELSFHVEDVGLFGRVALQVLVLLSGHVGAQSLFARRPVSTVGVPDLKSS